MHGDYSAWRFWLDVGQMLATVGIGVYVWWTSREKVTSRRFAVLEEEVRGRVPHTTVEKLQRERDAQCTRHTERTAALEINLHTIPTRQEVAAISTDIGTLSKQVSRVEGRIEGVGRALDLINEFLINQGGRKP